MVHIVRKEKQGRVYLALQRSLYDKKTGKRSTQHVAYLGPEDKVSKKKIAESITYWKKLLTRKLQ